MGYVDIAIISLVALFMIFGFFKGFKKSMKKFLTFSVSLVLAAVFCKIVANALLSIESVGKIVAGSKGSVFKFMYDLLPKSLGNIKNTHLITAYGAGKATGAGDAYLQEMFTGGGFDNFFLRICYPMFKGSLSNPQYLAAGMGAREIIALEMSFALFAFIVGFLLFIAFRIIAAILIAIFSSSKDDDEEESKSVGGRFIAMIVGGARGALHVFILLLLVSMLSNISFMSPVNEQIDTSTLGKPMYKISTSVADTLVSDELFGIDYASSRYERMFLLMYGENATQEQKDQFVSQHNARVTILKDAPWSTFLNDTTLEQDTEWSNLDEVDEVAVHIQVILDLLFSL